MNISLYKTKTQKAFFVLSELCISYLRFKPPLKILFSNREEWKPRLEKGFRYTSHELFFEKFTRKNISKIDLVVPTTIEDLVYLNSHPELVKNNAIPIPNLTSVRICNDKKLFYEKLDEYEFNDYLPYSGKQQSYPYMLKKRYDEAGAHTEFIENAAQESLHTALIESDEYFCQQFIPGETEYATHILFKENKVAYSITIKYNFSQTNPIHGKMFATHTNLIKTSPFLEIFSEILKAINYQGLCCIDYKILNGQPAIFEINPRPGISLCPFFFSLLKVL